MGSYRVRSCFRSARLIRFAVALSASLFAPTGAHAGQSHARVVVAWTDGPTSEGYIRSFPATAPWDFDTQSLNVAPNATLRLAASRLYAVSRTDATVSVIDPDTWTVLHTHSVGAGREPVDIAVVAPDRAYVSCADETHLLRFNPLTGEMTPAIDLSLFADADGNPELNMMALHEGRLFIQLRRIDSTKFNFVSPAMIAVVDASTEQLVDANGAIPGTQAIALQGMAPKLKMQVVESTRQLWVSASGDFFDNGGIEIIDLDTLQSLGLIVHEEDGLTGADLGAFIMVTPHRGYLTFSTDFAVSSHMVEFTAIDGVLPGGALFETVGYFVPTLPHDPQSDTFFFPDGGTFPSAVHVLDADTGSHVATQVLGEQAFPTDMVIIPAAQVAGIPAASTWGTLSLALLTLIAATVLLLQHAPPARNRHSESAVPRDRYVTDSRSGVGLSSTVTRAAIPRTRFQ